MLSALRNGKGKPNMTPITASLYPRYALDRRLGGPQSRSVQCGEDKNQFPLPGTKPLPSSP
jgi:hypothetical protein